MKLPVMSAGLCTSLDRRGRSTAAVHEPARMEDFVPRDQWDVYRRVIVLAKERNIAFAVSGGFATSFYTGAWRNTKDLDLCVLPRDRDAMVQVTSDAGLRDLYDDRPYDRAWIYRATSGPLIVDLIWQLANYFAEVDEAWLAYGPEVWVYGDRVRLVPPEEMIFSKIHVVQRERCDFPDIVNILYTCGERLDWPCLFARLAGDEQLLASVLSLFAWLAPQKARGLPPIVWRRLGLRVPAGGMVRNDDRIRRLDSRPWFSPVDTRTALEAGLAARIEE